ncbi:hypothetical protein EP01_06950 [Bdellovibrio bacteriovorus]|uniref:hypothetical protein n=1 Tax=Bdellovibrio bacteriovorus TaxID=959 RepID=UPI00045C0FEE|nr:hypothetical protein [Bdellovibrio bacteriovorus]AHZ84674.1 hypothetical protein EP01_06950 [Bdellovibrio bacteriovorus]
MAHRYGDTNKWKMKWFRELSPTGKSVYAFIFDNCDHAGILEIDLDDMSFKVNEKTSDGSLKQLTIDDIKAAANGKIQFLAGDKIFLEGFVLYQYKLKSLADLNPNNRVHKSVMDRLEQLGLMPTPQAAGKPLESAFQGPTVGLAEEDVDVEGEVDGEAEEKGKAEIADPYNHVLAQYLSAFPGTTEGPRARRCFGEQILTDPKAAAQFTFIKKAIHNYATLLKKQSWRTPKQSFEAFLGWGDLKGYWRGFIEMPTDLTEARIEALFSQGKEKAG